LRATNIHITQFEHLTEAHFLNGYFLLILAL
jgi:hypothetical protein